MWTHLIRVTVYFAITKRSWIKQRNQPGLMYSKHMYTGTYNSIRPSRTSRPRVPPGVRGLHTSRDSWFFIQHRDEHCDKSHKILVSSRMNHLQHSTIKLRHTKQYMYNRGSLTHLHPYIRNIFQNGIYSSPSDVMDEARKPYWAVLTRKHESTKLT